MSALLRDSRALSDTGARRDDGEHSRIVLPILVAFGFLTRWAALGLLVMTGVIQLTYPGGWANFHLYWAAMALAIVTFGPGAISVDRLLGFDGWSGERRGN